MSGYGTGELIACHDCDHLHRYEPLPPRAHASCRRCGALLYRHVPESLDRSLALYLAALILFFIANCYPFLGLKIGGRIEENVLLSGGWALYHQGMGELGLLVFLTSIAFPLAIITGMLSLLIPVRRGRAPRYLGPVYRLVQALMPWSLVGVFMLGSLIAIVKLQDIATVVPGIAMYAIAALLAVFSAARAVFEPRSFWNAVPFAPETDTAGGNLLACHTCGLLGGAGNCPRCGTPRHARIVNSEHRTWALVISAAMLLIPANVYPVMTVIRFGQGEPNTILTGILNLIDGGMWGLALIVFFASMVVPLLKLVVLSLLLLSIRRRSAWRPRDRTLLYRFTEAVGAWSMVDVFLVGLLTGLVSLGTLATIRPGIGAVFFAAVVVITMFAAHSFDPRLIWDNLQREEAD